jgi:glycine/D-amino acid oxidase-like deaminating enzyme
LTLVGNGILSLVSALKVKSRNPQIQMAIVGPASKPYCASYAAGAMHAVFCEVEDTFRDLLRDREIFDVSLEARAQWRELISEFNLQEVVTAESTVMYRRKHGTPFEIANFEAACSIAKDYEGLGDVSAKELETLFCGKLKPADVVARKFVGEFAMDAETLLSRLELLLEKMGVVFVDSKVQKLSRVSGGVQILLSNNEVIDAGRAVLGAGSESAKLLPKELPMVPLYHAVGTAMVLDSAPPGYSKLNLVVRTPNRGGAQCGLHIVPRNSGKFYLGAGSYLSDQEPAHRVETIRYLINICDDELYGRKVIYNAKTRPLLGARPKSMDGYPIVGTWKEFPELFVTTGMYRFGLTVAPVIAEDVCHWVENGEASGKFQRWSPSRPLHTYASMEVATRYYAESRISNLIEHGLLSLDQVDAVAAKRVELENTARKLNAEIIQKHKLQKDFVVDPDMYALLAASN